MKEKVIKKLYSFLDGNNTPSGSPIDYRTIQFIKDFIIEYPVDPWGVFPGEEDVLVIYKNENYECEIFFDPIDTPMGEVPHLLISDSKKSPKDKDFFIYDGDIDIEVLDLYLR